MSRRTCRGICFRYKAKITRAKKGQTHYQKGVGWCGNCGTPTDSGIFITWHHGNNCPCCGGILRKIPLERVCEVLPRI